MSISSMESIMSPRSARMNCSSSSGSWALDECAGVFADDGTGLRKAWRAPISIISLRPASVRLVSSASSSSSDRKRGRRPGAGLSADSVLRREESSSSINDCVKASRRLISSPSSEPSAISAVLPTTHVITRTLYKRSIQCWRL